MDFETISRMVRASGVSEGELILVHFWGEDADKEIANRFVAAVAAAGASPVLLQQSRTVNRDLFSSAKAGCFDDKYFELFSKFDAVLDVFAYQPVILGFALEETQMDLYRKYISTLFGRLMGCKRFTQIRIPTEANAREWLTDAGDGDLPCGEIYIAPVEDRTNGSVFFDTLRFDGVQYPDVTIWIRNGEITGSSNPELAGRFAEMPKENRTVCELGLGMNPNVTDLCGYTVLDEKMAGTFHIAIGANTMFGGTNEASDHIDMVGYGKVEISV